jgi:hypothetical protein
MVLFPIAFIWIAAVLVWIIWKGGTDRPESPPPEPRRFRPRRPRHGPDSGHRARTRRTEARR